jgi:hypothetical protein
MVHGEIIDIGTFEDEFKNTTYRVVLELKEKPTLRLGEAEVTQK